MALDIPAIATGVGAIISAGGAVYIGILTGRGSKSKDEAVASGKRAEAMELLEKIRQSREIAEETAGQARLENMARDVKAARERLREVENEHDDKMRELRTHSQKGWDLAAHHWRLLVFVNHLMNNVFSVMALADESGDELHTARRVLAVLRTSFSRMQKINIPAYLEEPLETNFGKVTLLAPVEAPKNG